MIVPSPTVLYPPSRWTRTTQSPTGRFVLGLLLIGIPFVLANAVTKLFMVAPELKDFRNPLKAAVLVVAYCCFVLWVERRSVFEFSLTGSVKELATGFGWSSALVGTVVAVLALMGCYHVNGWSSGYGMLQMLQLHLFVAVLEEVLFRGILFRLLENIVGTWVALVLSTLLFGLAHLGNPGANGVTLGCLVILSIGLTLAYLVTRRLWMCIGMHWAWNFVQGGIFSLPVSGTNVWPGVLAAKAEGPAWATGGAFGIEASVITLVLIAALSLFFLRVAQQRQHWKRWRPLATPQSFTAYPSP